MRYWDSSALTPLLLEEPASPGINRLIAEDSAIVSWWGTSIECFSALWRRRREGFLTEANFEAVRQTFDSVFAEIDLVSPSNELRDRAMRLLSLHPLRTGDALQLAAALRWIQEKSRGAGFVTLDARLRTAALAEGFSVFP